MINSSAGTNIIQAGNDGSQLWGGNDTQTDTLLGGVSTDIFIGGKYQGSEPS